MLSFPTAVSFPCQVDMWNVSVRELTMGPARCCEPLEEKWCDDPLALVTSCENAWPRATRIMMSSGEMHCARESAWSQVRCTAGRLTMICDCMTRKSLKTALFMLNVAMNMIEKAE